MKYPKLLFISDCYKYTHAAMYPNGVEEVYSLLYCRNPRLDLESLNGHIVAFGMRQVIHKLQQLYYEFKQCEENILREALEWIYIKFMKLNPNEESYKFLVEKWLNLPDEMPVTFKALPEGTFVSNNTPIISVLCQKSEHCWFVNFIETYLNSELWKTCFVATKAALFKKIEYDFLQSYIDKSLNFHDFAARGMNGIEDCYISSMGHLLFFSGTDSLMAIRNVYDNYGKSIETLGSIPASEHSVMCLGGQQYELETFKRIMEKFPHSMVSIVADTWNLWNIIDLLKNDKEMFLTIQNRKQPIVLRPDSGDPFLILTGNPHAHDDREKKGVIRLVHEYFGFHHVRIIYGDAITIERARMIYEWCKHNNFNPLEFLCLGIGSYAYNSGIRDDVGLVTKMTWAKINGKSVHLIKNPITGKDKISLSGKVAVKRDTREVVQYMDYEIENDLLSTDMSLEDLDSIRIYAKSEFLRAIGIHQDTLNT
ncbi:nicotinamide phosphoribosyltransferase [Helicobacter didelphidarum]|uniref:Nicotinamide phosphoribosyltransferase n=1 Tax=Helicobacter didelphidarum TaxID=2040648 RepID=A0A3D8ILS6_9HELI|nr:nicotinamide phosphoribosyltransferase domain-containing protein [Helicobacter didelphidarum]RDU66227.1 nicotinamide phosphoribosyltransferase [Helicobacter didelphidarum]